MTLDEILLKENQGKIKVNKNKAWFLYEPFKPFNDFSTKKNPGSVVLRNHNKI